MGTGTGLKKKKKIRWFYSWVTLKGSMERCRDGQKIIHIEHQESCGGEDPVANGDIQSPATGCTMSCQGLQTSSEFLAS